VILAGRNGKVLKARGGFHDKPEIRLFGTDINSVIYKKLDFEDSK
jgi:hypothetical protein